MNYIRRLRYILPLITASLFADKDSVVWAQKAPAVGYVFPAGGKAGTTVEVILGGYDWTPDVQFLLHESSVKLELIDVPGEVIPHLPPYWFGIKSMVNDPPLPREVTARFVIPGDQPAGPIRWCVANANGGSPCGLFMVGHGNEIQEAEDRSPPQKLTELPVVVNGRLLRIEEIDRYQLRMPHSGLVTCDLMARRLGSDFNGVLEVLNHQGNKIAEAYDTEGQDPILTFFANADEDYTVTVRDLDYRGYRSLTYRLALTTGPRVVTTIPTAMRRGERQTVEFVGIGIATGQPRLESTTREVEAIADPAQTSFSYTLLTHGGEALNVTLATSDFPERVEPDSLDLQARRLTVPTALTGRFRTREERDRYLISGVKGDTWNLTALGRSAGPPLDLSLTVIDPDGKEVATNDDAPGTTDSKLSLTLPADADYEVVVSEHSGTTDTIGSIYRLIVEKPGPQFRLRTAGVVNLPISSPAAHIEGTVVREAGFSHPIKLTATGLPTGVTATETVIDSKASSFKIPLTIDPKSPVSTSLVQVCGTAEIDGREQTITVLAPATGSLVVRDPEASLVPVILMTTTLKPPYKIKPTEADGGRRVHRGATHLAELIIDRDAGFTGEIVLDMSAVQSRHRQGIHGPRLAIPPAVRSVEYPVFVPECLETARTSRLGLIAMAKVVDPGGNERTVLGPVEGQITMSIEGALLKLSHMADELIVPIGQSFTVPMKLARSSKLTGPVSVELHVPTELSERIHAPSFSCAAEKEDWTWTIETKADPRLLGPRILTAKATALKDGYPVISECEIRVEFVEASLTQTGP